MRQYRGKTGEGKWVYGWYQEKYTLSSAYRETGPYIEWIEDGALHSEEVISASVGQSTGLYEDKTPIYADDIFKVVFECLIGEHEIIGIVNFCESTATWMVDFLNHGCAMPLYKVIEEFNYGLIGNAIDSPTLLEVTDEQEDQPETN